MGPQTLAERMLSLEVVNDGERIRTSDTKKASNKARAMIPTRIHAILDYLTGALLIVAPFVLNFADGSAAQWLPILLGAITILMSLITRYELSLARIVPFRVHLGIDMASGILLAASPWLFGFADRIWWPHVVVGLVEIVVPLLTRRDPDITTI